MKKFVTHITQRKAQ